MPDIDLNRLVGRLEPFLRVGLEGGASLAARHSHASVEVAHWLRALLDGENTLSIFSTAGIDTETLRRELDLAIDDLVRGSGTALALSTNVLALAREAWLIASLQFGRDTIRTGDLLIALGSDQSLRLLVRAIAPSLRGADLKAVEAELKSASAEPRTETPPGKAVATGSEDEFLRLYTQDMTADARSGRIDPVIGRSRELGQVIDVLMRRRQNNPILVGEAGVGKTAIAEALALAIASGAVPERLREVRLLSLDLSLLQAGAGVKGEFERRLHGVVDAVKASSQPIILFIDEAHSLIGAGGQTGQGDAANILKPSLARGELRTVAATTWPEYKRYIEKDAALTRRFQTVKVDEPDEATAVNMLRGVAGAFVDHHGVAIRDEALSAAVKLSMRYMPARQLPDKAISLIDTAAASVALARETRPEALTRLATERELLEAERDWLTHEPKSGQQAQRLEQIAERVDVIDIESGRLETRYRAEMDLVEKADRLEQAGEDISALEADLANLGGETPLVPRVVNTDVIATLVAKWTGIPVGKLLADDVDAVQRLDTRLKERVIGQDWALDRIAAHMKTARAGLADPRRPPGVFLLVGMSGTGKTETALSLADLLYGGNQYLTTINMSEFKEEHKISMLLGSPPGYVGFGEGGVLTEAVRRRPYGVLLLDEIDKAHPGVQEIFYQVFDKGILRDGEGRDVDFKNTTILMTANTGSEILTALAADPDTMPEGEALERLLLPELQKQFKPAFVGRTTVLPFMPLGKPALARIVDIQIDKIAGRVRLSYGTELILSSAARDALVDRAENSELGARLIENMIARDLLPALSSFFLEAVAAKQSFAQVEIGFDGQAFSVTGKATPAVAQSKPDAVAMA